MDFVKHKVSLLCNLGTMNLYTNTICCYFCYFIENLIFLYVLKTWCSTNNYESKRTKELMSACMLYVK